MEGEGAPRDRGPLPEAGWYDDPHGTGGQRWWDGSQWTDHFHPPPPPGAAGGGAPPDRVAGGKDPRNNGLAVVGWITAILFPLIGAIVGIVLMTRKDIRGGRILLLAAVIFVLGLVLVSAVDQNPKVR